MVIASGSTPDGPARGRAGRGCPDSGRCRGRGPVRRPEPVRVLDRHRTHRGLLRRDRPAPALPGREPADEPHDPHRRGHPDPPRHPRPGVLPAQARRRQDPGRGDALPEAQDLRRPVPAADRRRQSRRCRVVEAGPGGHRGASHESSAAGSHPHTGTSDQPLPGPAPTTLPAPTTPRKTNTARASRARLLTTESFFAPGGAARSGLKMGLRSPVDVVSPWSC